MSDELPSAAKIRRLLPRYRIGKQIGRGGMSVVYLAEDLGPLKRKRVALKVLTPALADDKGFRRRFLQESEIVANLEHPNVIPIYDAGEAGDLLYLVMRYVDGPDLRVLLQEEGPLEPARLALIVRQVSGALAVAHREGLVHRDVKPANVMIDRPGVSDEHAILCDFGITKVTTATETLTDTGHFLGTLDYIAPEQIEGRGVDPRTDVYSLGCVVYQCLTGRVPYPLDTDMAKLLAHVREPVPSLRAARPDLPPAVDAVVATAMAKDPDDRFDSCPALADALRDALPGAPAGPTAARPAAGGAGGMNPSTRRGLLIGAAAAVLILIVALAAALLGGDDGPSAAEKELAQRDLIAALPYSFSDNACAGQESTYKNVVASVRCAYSSSRVVYYTKFEDKQALDAAYESAVKKGKVKLNTGTRGGKGCPAETPTSYTDTNQPAGRRGCWFEGPFARVTLEEWRESLLTEAFDDPKPDSVESLYDWVLTTGADLS